MADLDLDVLQPKSKTVKIGDATVEIKPPSFDDYLKLIEIRSEMMKLNIERQKAEATKQEGKEGVEKTSEEKEIDASKRELTNLKAMQDFKEVVDRIAPEMKDYKLSFIQKMSLVKFILESVIPEETKELEKMGIDVAEKKSQSDQPESSLIS